MGTVLCLNSGNRVDEVLRYCHMIDEFMELMTDPDEEAFYEMEIGDFLELEDVLDRSAMDSYESEYSKESGKKSKKSTATTNWFLLLLKLRSMAKTIFL